MLSAFMYGGWGKFGLWENEKIDSKENIYDYRIEILLLWVDGTN